MVKIRFPANEKPNIFKIIEKSTTNSMDIADWIIRNIKDISFDCMDFSCDMEFSYDCYFQTDNDEVEFQEIYHMLKKYFLNFQEVSVLLWITDNKLNEIGGL